MIVYRLEHPADHIGPYQSAQVPKALQRKLQAHHSRGEHPDALADIVASLGLRAAMHMMLSRSQWRCAFTGLDELHAWFGVWLDELAQAGCQVVSYEIDESYVMRASRQCMFAADKAQRRMLTAA